MLSRTSRRGHASNFGPGQLCLPPKVCILRSEVDTLPVDKGYESTVTDYPGERDCSVDVHRRRSQSSGVDAPSLPRFDLHAVDVPVPRIHAQLEEDHSPNPAANSFGPSVGYGRLDSSLNARTSQTTSDNSQQGLALASDTDAVGGAVTGDLAVHSRCVNVRPVGIERVTAGAQHGTPAEPELHLDSLVLNDSGGEEKLTPASGLPPPLEWQVVPTAHSRRGGEDGRERIRGGRESDEHGVSGSNVDQNSVTLDTETTTRLSSKPLFLDNDSVVVRRSGNSTDGVYSHPGVGSDLHSPVLESICSRESLVAQDNSGPDRQHGVGMVSRQGRRDQKPGSVIGGRGDAPLGAEEENPALRRAHPRGLERVGGEFATSRARMPRFRTHPTHAALLSDIITIGYGLPNSTRRSQLEDTSISVPSDRSFMGADIDGLIRIPVQLSSTDVLQLDTGRERIRDERLLDPLGISVGVVCQRTVEPAIEDPAEGSFGSSRSALHNPLLDATAVVAITTQLSDGPPAPDTRVPGSIAGPARPGLAGAPGSTTAIRTPDHMEAQRSAVDGYGLS